MRRLGVAFSTLAVCVFLCSPALADPKENMRKLAQDLVVSFGEKKEAMPPCPLTDEEITELSAWIGKAYAKQGQELSPLQVTLMIGALTGYAVAKDEFGPKKSEGAKIQDKEKKTAGALPEYDIAAYCKRVSDTSGGSYMIEEGCRDMEKEAKDALTGMSIPDKILKYCSRVAETGGKSYLLLQGCVDMELEAKEKVGGK